MRTTRGRRVASAVLTVGLVAAAAACTQPPPDFYNPPGSPSGEPGAVLRVEPSSFGGSSAHTAVAVQYRSTTATGEANAVTGTVVVPDAPWTGEGARPIVSHAVGTQGLGDHCAPSKSIGGGTVYEQGAFRAMLDRGWAVAITDYEKLGGPGDHTYVVAAAEAHAVLDIVRAAMQIDELGLDPSAPVGILGYSQGGQAAAKVAEIEGTYAPELDVQGVVAGGVPSDLADLAAFLDGGPFFTFLGYAAIGLNSAYPELDLESYLSPDGEALLDTARESCLADGLLIGAFQSIDNLTTANPLEQPDWQARVAENQLGNTAPEVPVLQYHAVFDEIIPFDQGTRLRDAWCDGGTQVRWSEYWLAEHAIGIFAGQQESIDFLDDRFTGQPFQPTCNG